jgi:hypothetical protein
LIAALPGAYPVASDFQALAAQLESAVQMFVIEDEWHAEWIGEFASRDDAYSELRRLATLPWDEAPNLCPCMSWRTCGRRYHLTEYDTSAGAWRRLSDEALLDVSAEKTAWLDGAVAAI